MSISQNPSTGADAHPRKRFCGRQTEEGVTQFGYQDISLEQDLLSEILPNQLLESFAEDTQAQDQRKRKLTCVVFFWLMVLAVGPGGLLSISSITGHLLVAGTLAGVSLAQANLSRQAFSENLKLRPWQFFEAVLHHLLKVYVTLAEASLPVPALELIQYLRLIDASTIRVTERLIQTFPGHRTGRKKEWAAIKLHMAFRFLRSIPQVLAITAEKVNEKQVDFLLPKGEKALYVFDLGYWKYKLLDQIIDRLQHFLCRLQEKCNPLILAVTLGDPNWVGQRLRSVCLDGFAEVDLLVNLSSDWPYSKAKMQHDVRLIGQPVEQVWHFYITSIFDELLYPVDLLAQLYALRWQIELFFRNLKCVLRIENFIALSENGIRIQIYVALIHYVLTHILMLKVAQQTQVPVEQMSVPKCLRAVQQTLLFTTFLVVKDQEIDWRKLEQYLLNILIGVHRQSVRKEPSRLAKAIDLALIPSSSLCLS